MLTRIRLSRGRFTPLGRFSVALIAFLVLILTGLTLASVKSGAAAGNFGLRLESTVGKLIKRIMPRPQLEVSKKAVIAAPFVTRTVNNGNDSGSGSLRNTIAAALAGDTIVFSGVTTVTLTSDELLIDKNLTINGGTNGVTITRSGGTQFRIFHIDSGVTAELRKLKITNGNNPGQAGGVQNTGVLTMIDCEVSGNASGQAGGVQNDNEITMTNCTIANNSSTGTGGGFVSFGSSNTLTNCTISNNTASTQGGGFYIGGGLLTLTNCTVANNSGSSGSGINNLSTVILKNTIVAANGSNNCGGTALDSSSSYNLIVTPGACGLTCSGIT